MIREAEISDIPRLSGLAKVFTESSKFVNVDETVFRRTWRTALEAGYGKVFISEKDGEVNGAIGAVASADAVDGKLTVHEMFWIVSPDARETGVGSGLLYLLEQWARKIGAEKLIMVHMLDLMPEAVAKIYEKNGFVPMEVNYLKEL